MSLLRRGITGFDADGTVDVSFFKKAVYAAAQSTGASVVKIEAGDSVSPNFHQANVALNDQRTISILCNRTHPIVAFVECPIAIGDFKAIDAIELAEIIRKFGFEIATADELNRSIEPKDLHLLGENERNQAKYWKPRRISQLVFNWWD
jgi:hypothetical protein